MQYIYAQDGMYVINQPATDSNRLQHLQTGDFFVIYTMPDDCPFLPAAIVGSIIESKSNYWAKRSLEKLGVLKDVMIHAFYYQNYDRGIPLKPGDNEEEVCRMARHWELTNLLMSAGSASTPSMQLNEPYSFNLTHGINKTVLEFMKLYLSTLNKKSVVVENNAATIPFIVQRENLQKVIKKMIELDMLTGELEFIPFEGKPSEEFVIPHNEFPNDYYSAGH